MHTCNHKWTLHNVLGPAQQICLICRTTRAFPPHAFVSRAQPKYNLHPGVMITCRICKMGPGGPIHDAVGPSSR